MRFSRSALHRGAAIAALALPAALVAQQSGPSATPVRVAHAARRTSEIHLDGRLDEPAWSKAEVTGDFTQSYPAQGKPAPDRTEVRVLYDDAAIYVGIRMFDPHPDSIAAELGRRDATAANGIYTDWVHLIIDSYHDRRTSFRFSANPVGVKKDVYTSNDGPEDINWDAIWEVGTAIDSQGWVAEYRIPLSQLRYGKSAAGQERVWGFQVQRDIARRNERDTWSPWTPQMGGFVSRFGDLAGLVDVAVPQRIEVTPYVSERATREPGEKANPFFHETASQANAGVDLKYGVPGGLTLSATVNPDFGQVEVDPAVVNLSAYESFFPEKRPFFLEGSDIFNFGQVVRQNDYGSQNFFYSRRVGRQPQRFVGGPTVAYVDAPEQARIAGAVKLSGKTGPWTVGLLDAVTRVQEASVQSVTGQRYDTPVEPLTNYLAGRVRRDFNSGATTIGAILQGTHRDAGDTVFVNLLRHRALFGGVDFEHDMQQRKYILSGFLGASRVDGSIPTITATERSSARYYQRPDAKSSRFNPALTSLQGHIGEVAFQLNGTNFASIAVKESSPGLELNDMGFQSRTDYRSLSLLGGRQSFEQSKHLRNWSAYAYTNQAWNFDDDLIFNAVAFGSNFTFNNLWNAGVGGGFNASTFSDRLLRGGPLAKTPSSVNANVYAGTDSRKRLFYNAGANWQRDDYGSTSVGGNVSVDARPSSNVHISFGPNMSVDDGAVQYVQAVTDANATNTYGRRYVFADLQQTTLGLDTRIDVTLSPTLSLQMYAQPFVAAGRYTGYMEFQQPGTYRFAKYGSQQGTIAPLTDTKGAVVGYSVDPDGAGSSPSFGIQNPNFNVRSLRGNAVVRWEYRPGSALFFVWQQQRSGFDPSGEFDAGSNVGDIFHTIPTNVFLVKATYWMGR
ncbi:MAG: hypothetical protein JWO05_72 [Gemmatimonadetes bacterium]|nr:hypothetical protein [Gemmatimonadota bacterium]